MYYLTSDERSVNLGDLPKSVDKNNILKEGKLSLKENVRNFQKLK